MSDLKHRRVLEQPSRRLNGPRQWRICLDDYSMSIAVRDNGSLLAVGMDLRGAMYASVSYEQLEEKKKEKGRPYLKLVDSRHLQACLPDLF